MKTPTLCSPALWLALALPVGLAGCGQREPTPAAVPEPDPATAASSTEIDSAEAQASGIEVAQAGAGVIVRELQAQGQLAAIDGRLAQVAARYPGRILALHVQVGDRVRAGQPLAVIESNLSLSPYAVSAPRSGVVLSRLAQVGGGAAEGQVLLEIGDLSQVRAELSLFGDQIGQVPAGAAVTLMRLYDGQTLQTTVEQVLPGAVATSQSAIARAIVDNADGQWRPGLAVAARIVVDRRQVALALPLAALQTMDGRPTVFVRRGDTYQARPVLTGARDGAHVEILEGLSAGEQVVVAQSYLVKADLEKSAASHEH